jgi:hypothetical protein
VLAVAASVGLIVAVITERSLVRSMPDTLARLVHASDVVFVTFS